MVSCHVWVEQSRSKYQRLLIGHDGCTVVINLLRRGGCEMIMPMTVLKVVLELGLGQKSSFILDTFTFVGYSWKSPLAKPKIWSMPIGDRT
jgi:hypothetical protein